MRKPVGMSLLLALFFGTALCAQTMPQIRLTPQEINAKPVDANQIGSSGLAGVHTTVLFGDPSKSGFYSILLFVPAHVSIQAHSHRDNRMATVVLGVWHLGYGDHFDAKKLKTLTPGSVYSEPGRITHFAQTGDTAVIVQISGYGPTDTKYFDPANDPAAKPK